MSVIDQLSKNFDVTGKVIFDENGKAVTYRSPKLVSGFQIAKMISRERERMAASEKIVAQLVDILEGNRE